MAMSSFSVTTEQVVVDKKAENGVMLIKYNVDIHPRDLMFLRRFVELKTSVMMFPKTIEERVERVIAFFQFLIDDVSGTENRFYRICEHKVLFRNESQPWASWDFIGNEIAHMLTFDPIHLLISYTTYSEVMCRNYLESVQAIINKLVDDHDFQLFTIELNEDDECDVNEEVKCENARKYIENEKARIMEEEKEYENRECSEEEYQNIEHSDSEDGEIDLSLWNVDMLQYIAENPFNRFLPTT